jgi:hypothetical protein
MAHLANAAIDRREVMKRRSLITGAAVVCAVAAAAPAASAATEPFGAAYTEKYVGPNAHPACPNDAFACGTGNADGLGGFTTERGFDEGCSCLVRDLGFPDGSTLNLVEDFVSFTGPGRSGSSPAPPTSEGHPGTYVLSWTVVDGSGRFAGASGNGTDQYDSAGLIASGTLSGTITTP